MWFYVSRQKKLIKGLDKHFGPTQPSFLGYNYIRNYTITTYFTHLTSIPPGGGGPQAMNLILYFTKLRKAQRSVLPYPKSVTFDIVSICFENKNNNFYTVDASPVKTFHQIY